MPVVSERCRKSLLFHDQETGAVGETPTLVGHVPISLQRLLEELACLRDNNDLGRVPKRCNRPCCRLAQTRPAIAEAVQKLSEAHFAGDDLVRAVTPRSRGGLTVEIVARV